MHVPVWSYHNIARPCTKLQWPPRDPFLPRYVRFLITSDTNADGLQVFLRVACSPDVFTFCLCMSLFAVLHTRLTLVLGGISVLSHKNVTLSSSVLRHWQVPSEAC